ncbi:MAG: c-type cytochrome [Rhizobacter sp.]
MSARRSRLWVALLVLVAAVAALAAVVAWLNVRGEAPVAQGVPAVPASADVVARGAYLARAGNCVGCHTSIDGEALAGGVGVDTPFGAVYAPNITPDVSTGIGSWSPSEFWRAMHHGRGKDGRLLYPAFPYPSFARVTRDDSDAIYAYLRSVKPVVRENRPHALRFPYNTQAALAVWRALFFKPETFVPDAAQSADWNRGKYLVQGLGHCAACHSSRNALGATSVNAEFAGGLMPDSSWYAPSLANPKEAGLQGWPRDEVVKLLKTGVSAHASVSGPMADVVYTSTQYLTEKDLDAMTVFLAAIPAQEPAPAQLKPAEGAAITRGAQVYEQRCVSCHGKQGEGVAGIYPALAGNRAVTLSSPNNLVQMIRHGGFAPSTAGNPRPFGMPPLGQALSHDEVAAVTTYMRQSWGHSASAVSSLEVMRVK